MPASYTTQSPKKSLTDHQRQIIYDNSQVQNYSAGEDVCVIAKSWLALLPGTDPLPPIDNDELIELKTKQPKIGLIYFD